MATLLLLFIVFTSFQAVPLFDLGRTALPLSQPFLSPLLPSTPRLLLLVDKESSIKLTKSKPVVS